MTSASFGPGAPAAWAARSFVLPPTATTFVLLSTVNVMSTVATYGHRVGGHRRDGAPRGLGGSLRECRTLRVDESEGESKCDERRSHVGLLCLRWRRAERFPSGSSVRILIEVPAGRAARTSLEQDLFSPKVAVFPGLAVASESTCTANAASLLPSPARTARAISPTRRSDLKVRPYS